MPRFVFRYQSLLNQRVAVEKQRQRELGVAVRRRQAMIDKLTRTQEVIRSSKRQLRDALTGSVDLSRIGGFSRYAAQTTANGHGVVRELAEAEQVIEFSRKRLHEAMRQRKALELLRDKQREAWEQEQARRETAELDELGSQGHDRRAREEVVG